MFSFLGTKSRKQAHAEEFFAHPSILQTKTIETASCLQEHTSRSFRLFTLWNERGNPSR
jgi:hypothetical protein